MLVTAIFFNSAVVGKKSHQPLTLLDVPKVFARISAANGVWRRSIFPRELGQARAEECAPGLEQDNRWTSNVGRTTRLLVIPSLLYHRSVVLGASPGLWPHTELTEFVLRKRGGRHLYAKLLPSFLFLKKLLILVWGDNILEHFMRGIFWMVGALI